MKKIFSLFLLSAAVLYNSQQASSLIVTDTRNTNNPPGDYSNEVKAEFKSRDIVGVPGEGAYSGMLTLAPWSDASGGKVYQLNFNSGGVYYRNGLQSSQWEGWQRLIVESQGVTKLNDFVSQGVNSWIFHTPDDQRRTLHIAPGLSEGQYDWSKQTIFNNNGNVAVSGKLEAKEVRVTQTPTADFVFEEDYALPTLEEVEKHIKEKKHLPEIASAKEMEKEGVNVGEFQIKLLQKIEELTLYSIEQNKQIHQLKKENESLKSESLQIKSLLERVERLEQK